MEFKMEDFYKDNTFLKDKYRYLGGRLEGEVYQVNELLVGKKFNAPRDYSVIHCANAMIETKQQSFLQPIFSLTEDNKVHASFSNYFNGKSLKEDLGVVPFSVVIPSVRDFICDIESLSLAGIMLRDVSDDSIMYNEKVMKAIDTTQYELLKRFSFDTLYHDNLLTFFVCSGCFNIPKIEYLRRQNRLLDEIYLDLDNYDSMFYELKNTLENLCEEPVSCINEGLAKVKKC